MDFQTRPDICQYMVSLIPSGVVSVLEPTPGEGNLVAALRSNPSFSVTAPEDFWSVQGRFDAIVMNPPFTPMQQGYKILFRCMEMSSEVIALMPWLIIINSERRTKRLLEFGLMSVTHLPRNAFPGARVQTCILKLSEGYQGDVVFRFYGLQ